VPPPPLPQVSGLQRELAALKSSVANAEVLRREVHHLNRELLVERSKVKALGEELESPLNVHRCVGGVHVCVTAGEAGAVRGGHRGCLGRLWAVQKLHCSASTGQ
jgi:hypothetical protein